MSDDYSGFFGAFPYAFRRSDSRLFRAYTAVGGLLAAILAIFFTFALVVTVASTANLSGGTITFVRSVFVLFGFLVVAPLVAPVLFVARHHRREGGDPGYDAGLAGAGVVYLVTLYLGAVASMPARFEIDGQVSTRPDPSGLAAPLVEALYAVPEALSWTIPLAGAVLILVVHRWLG
ncbi:hypothetical protein [Natronomonas marina]|jgi:hypothetical protein|uniref:hypothetical protein n=1 Tax=Natronomonas marina TaxID=2961939 RepID=UPI0020CA0E36|nr:hypothetical protein [Natronomonas marina]